MSSPNPGHHHVPAGQVPETVIPTRVTADPLRYLSMLLGSLDLHKYASPSSPMAYPICDLV